VAYLNLQPRAPGQEIPNSGTRPRCRYLLEPADLTDVVMTSQMRLPTPTQPAPIVRQNRQRPTRDVNFRAAPMITPRGRWHRVCACGAVTATGSPCGIHPGGTAQLPLRVALAFPSDFSRRPAGRSWREHPCTSEAGPLPKCPAGLILLAGPVLKPGLVQPGDPGAQELLGTLAYLLAGASSGQSGHLLKARLTIDGETD